MDEPETFYLIRFFRLPWFARS